MDPAQPARPLLWYRDFEPADISDPGAVVQLHALCEACLRVRSWLQDCYDVGGYDIDIYQTQTLNLCRTGRDLEKAYKDGCHLCTLLWHSLVERPDVLFHQRRLEGRNIRLGHVREGSEVKLLFSGPFVVAGVEFPDGDNLSGQSLPLHVGPPLPQNSPVRLFSHLVPPSIKGVSTSTCSESALAQGRTWLEECTQNHPGCRWQPSHIFPRRLLAVSRQSDGIHLQLKQSNELQDPSSCKWVCLSYCWGRASTLKLTRSTSTLLQHGIMADLLPKTIRDASSVVLEFGLEFLWVDALCILQDSPEDWLHEAESMGDIYRGSFLTLSALGVSDSSAGLFANRDPLMYSACSIPVKDRVVAIYPSWSSSNRLNLRMPWPLYTRGWVLQERLLSRRTLRFGPTLSWECWQSAAYELDPTEHGLMERDDPKLVCSSFYQLVIDPGCPRAPPEDKQGQLLSLWDILVYEFSRANLTVPSDREAALLGLVSAFALRTGWQYMAGYWLPLTVRHLLWKPADDNTEARRTGLSPSWSWLSITGGIRFIPSDSTDDEEYLAEIEVANDKDVTTVNSAEATCRAVPVRLSCLRLRTRPLGDGRLKPPDGWPPFNPLVPKGDVSRSFQDEVSILPLAVSRHSEEMYVIVVSTSKLYPGAYERVGFLITGGWSASLRPETERFREMMVDVSLREEVILV